jgi:methyl-accepting chemotaxis protein
MSITTESITTDVRKYRETVLQQSKLALDEARKPWYAAVGAGDLAYGQLQRQLTQLPVEVQDRLRRLQSGAAQVDAAHLRDAVETAAGQAREVYAAYVGQARETYESLAHRGELVVRRLRRSPEVREAFDKAEELIAEAGETVEKVGEKVEQVDEKVTRPAGTRRAPGGTPARKAPAKRAGARA